MRLAAIWSLFGLVHGAPDPLAAGTAALDAGRPRSALPLLADAARANPANAQAHLRYARAALALDDGATAEAEILRARDARIDIRVTRHLLAEAYLEQGDADRALAEAAAAPRRFAGAAARIRAKALAENGDAAGARAAFADAQRLSPRDPRTWVDLARFNLDQGDAAGANTAAGRAVAVGPRDVAALVLEGERVRAQYGLLAALPWFDRALMIDPQDVPALIARAATLGDMGRMRAMLAATRAVIAIDPRNAQAWYLQAVLAARAHRYRLAETLMARTGTMLADNPGAMLLTGMLDIQAGNVEQAIAVLAKLVDGQPDNVKARRMLALAQWRAHDYPSVVETLGDSADQPQADSYTLTLVGRAYEKTGHRARAAAYLDRAAIPRLASAEVVPQRVDDATLAALRDRAAHGGAGERVALIRALLGSGRVIDGIAEAASLRDANPGVPAAHVLAGDALAAAGRWREAADAYRGAANIAFTEPVALRYIDALRRSGQAPQAQSALMIFLDQNPQSAPAQLLGAEVLMAAGRFADAVPVLEQLRRRLGPGDVAIGADLAWAYAGVGRRAEALALAADAWRRAPVNPATAATYGWLLQGTPEAPHGLALLEQAAGQRPHDPLVRWRLAQAYLAAGRRADAKAAAASALATPGFTGTAPAKAMLARLAS